ncbi:MAG: hypothetical protein INR62_03810 [Rhodospirillales bacterium]|nr:hypothetical protein [Acetobacter sp.]
MGLMPRPYPPELRRRALAAGRHSQAEIATRFGVSAGWVEKILRERRRLGHVPPVCLEHVDSSKHHGGGAPLRVTLRAMQVIRAVVGAQSDITLERLRVEVHRQTGVQVSASTLWHRIKDLDLRRLRKSTASQMRAWAGHFDKAQRRESTRRPSRHDKPGL